VQNFKPEMPIKAIKRKDYYCLSRRERGGLVSFLNLFF
jgi:hypothetical protein